MLVIAMSWKILHLYVKGLLYKKDYLLVWLFAIALFFLLPHRSPVSNSELNVTITFYFWIFAYVLYKMIEPRQLLALNDFHVTLPGEKERLALVGWMVITPPFLVSLWPFYPFSPILMLYGNALLVFTLLVSRSIWAIPSIIILFLLSLAVFHAVDVVALVLLCIPCLIEAILLVGNRITNYHWYALYYSPRRVLLIAAILLMFDLYLSGIGSSMKLTIEEGAINFRNPDFSQPLLLTAFFGVSTLVMLLPFVNLIGVRWADIFLFDLRAIQKTPFSRRIMVFILGCILNLPCGVILYLLQFTEIEAWVLVNILLIGVFVHTVFRTDERSRWLGYAAGLYLVLTHSIALWSSPWFLFICFITLVLIFYDIDMLFDARQGSV